MIYAMLYQENDMRLFHGSKDIIRTPEYGRGSPFNDYGLGFYCTEDIELAKEWACPIAKDGFANIYELDVSNLNVMNLSDGKNNTLNWMALLLKNRTFIKKSPISKQASDYIIKEFLPDTTGYDVIRGYRADNSYFSYAKDFLNNTISLRQLSESMRFGKLGEQIVLISPMAFNNIKFKGYEVANASIYNTKRIERDNEARFAYRDYDSIVAPDDLFVRDILMQEVKNDDPRL